VSNLSFETRLVDTWRRQSMQRENDATKVRIVKALLLKYGTNDDEGLLLARGAEWFVSLAGKRDKARVDYVPLAKRLKVAEQRRIAAIRGREHVNNVVAKSVSFDRIVEMLDHYDVEGKLLGDCTRSDLLRAAALAQGHAGEWAMRASFYKELASIIGKGTVREAANRGQIVGLLTTTFSESQGE